MGMNIYTIGVVDEIIPGRITAQEDVLATTITEAFLEMRKTGKYRTKTLAVLCVRPDPGAILEDQPIEAQDIPELMEVAAAFTDTPAARWHRALWGYTPTEDERAYMETQEGRYLSDEDEILHDGYEPDSADDNWGGW